MLVAGRNFGCGSSREHAPWALLDFGFRAVISTELADIFRSNSLKNGLLPIVVDEATHAWLLANPGVEVEIDLPAATSAAAGWPRRAIPDRSVLALLPHARHRRTRLPAEPVARHRPIRNSGAGRAMKARIAVLGGDGIGPEVTAEAVRVLQAVAEQIRPRIRVHRRR